MRARRFIRSAEHHNDVAHSAKRKIGLVLPMRLAPVRELPPKTKYLERERNMIRKLKSGKYRLYSRKTDPKTGKRRNLGTFGSRSGAEKHEKDVQYFKRNA
jgi:hypothetical protein